MLHLHSEGLEPKASKSPSGFENRKPWAVQQRTSTGVFEISSEASPRRANRRMDRTRFLCLNLFCSVSSLTSPGGVRMAPIRSGSTCFSSHPVGRASLPPGDLKSWVMCPSLSQPQMGFRDRLKPEPTWSWGCVSPTQPWAGKLGVPSENGYQGGGPPISAATRHTREQQTKTQGMTPGHRQKLLETACRQRGSG